MCSSREAQEVTGKYTLNWGRDDERILRRIPRKIDCSTDWLQIQKVKGSVRGLRGSKGPECEIRRKQDNASDLTDAGCLLFVRETAERQAVFQWINYYSLST